MRPTLFSFLLPLLSVNVQAQTEFVTQLEDTTLCVGYVSHGVDAKGNLIVGANIYWFYGGPGTLFEGPAPNGTSIFKISGDSTIEWVKQYPTHNSSGLGLNYAAAYKCLPKGSDTILLPYCTYSGQNGWAPRKGAIAEINSRNGDVYRNVILDDTISENLVGTFYASGGLRNFYFSRNERNAGLNSLYVENIDKQYNRVSKRELDSDYYETKYEIDYDAANGEYLFCNRLNYLSVCDENFKEKRRYQLFFDTLSLQYFQILNFRFNSKYYIINYTAQNKQTLDVISYTLVIDKAGNRISLKESQRFNDITITDDNEIWGVYNYNWLLGTHDPQQPVTIVQMDIQQRVQREIKAGFPFVIARNISIYNGEEVIVTGTLMTDLEAAYPNKKPAGLYVYRNKIAKMPVVSGAGNCKDFMVSPNPTTGLIHIVGPEQGQLTLLNSLGQIVQRETITSGFSERDYSAYPAGVYFVQVRNNSGSLQCSMKILKQ